MVSDPNMVVTGECNEGAELEKRTYLPGIVIKSKCPQCGEPYRKDMSDNYLSYPKVGEPYELHGYCRNESCGHEWFLGSVVVGLTLTVGGTPSPGDRQAKTMVADMLDGLDCPLRNAVRGELSPDDCTHEDADRALDALQRVLRA